MGNSRTPQPVNRAVDLLRGTAPWGFPLLYLGWAYLFWLPVIASDESVWTFPNVVLFLIGGASPLLAGRVLMWTNHGRTGFADLRQRLFEIGCIAGRWWVIILLFYPVYNHVVASVAHIAGVSADPLAFISPDRLFDPGALFFLFAVALLFPAIEEIGTSINDRLTVCYHERYAQARQLFIVSSELSDYDLSDSRIRMVVGCLVPRISHGSYRKPLVDRSVCVGTIVRGRRGHKTC